MLSIAEVMQERAARLARERGVTDLVESDEESELDEPAAPFPAWQAPAVSVQPREVVTPVEVIPARAPPVAATGPAEPIISPSLVVARRQAMAVGGPRKRKTLGFVRFKQHFAAENPDISKLTKGEIQRLARVAWTDLPRRNVERRRPANGTCPAGWVLFQGQCHRPSQQLFRNLYDAEFEQKQEAAFDVALGLPPAKRVRRPVPSFAVSAVPVAAPRVPQVSSSRVSSSAASSAAASVPAADAADATNLSVVIPTGTGFFQRALEEVLASDDTGPAGVAALLVPSDTEDAEDDDQDAVDDANLEAQTSLALARLLDL